MKALCLALGLCLLGLVRPAVAGALGCGTYYNTTQPTTWGTTGDICDNGVCHIYPEPCCAPPYYEIC
jgi:hypothetical protein